VISVTDPYGRILRFLDRSRYFFFQVAPQLYSRRWVDPVTDSLLLKKSGRAGNRTRTSGSVARNYDHYTTEAVAKKFMKTKNANSFTVYRRCGGKEGGRYVQAPGVLQMYRARGIKYSSLRSIVKH
jgi:hypothetical protein